MKVFETVKELRKYASENYVENGEIFICKEEIKTPIKYKFFTTSDAEFHNREKQRFGDWFFKWIRYKDMNEYTTNQPIGSTAEGSEWQTEPQKNNCGEKYCSRIHPDEPPKRNLEQQLCDVLINHTGEHGQNEGAVECLERIIRERDLLLKRAVEDMLKPADKK